MNNTAPPARFLREAMTANEIADAQSEHYQLDDTIRRSTGSLTAAQKAKVIDYIKSLKGSEA